MPNLIEPLIRTGLTLFIIISSVVVVALFSIVFPEGSESQDSGTTTKGIELPRLEWGILVALTLVFFNVLIGIQATIISCRYVEKAMVHFADLAQCGA